MLVVTMDIPLTKDQSIYLILLQKISISTICQNIILLKNKIEINKRFGMPIFIPLIALITCLLLSSRNEKKISGYYKYFYFFIGVVIIISAEITVRYSGNSINHTAIYYSIPIGLLPLIYLYLIRTFKYENLN